jgi:precorrin-4/cobalt-precorrin-4 C11-methyltransferase
VIYRASWPDEERVTGTLVDIAQKVLATDIERTALILVGRVLAAEGFADSTLYGAQKRQD